MKQIIQIVQKNLPDPKTHLRLERTRIRGDQEKTESVQASK